MRLLEDFGLHLLEYYILAIYLRGRRRGVKLQSSNPGL